MHGNNKAQALVIAMIVMTITVSTAVGILTLTRSSYQSEQMSSKNDQAYYLAQSAQEIARYRLNQDFNVSPATSSDIPIQIGATNGFIRIESLPAVNGVVQVTTTGIINHTQYRIIKSYKNVQKTKEALWFGSIRLISEDGIDVFPYISLTGVNSISADSFEGTAWISNSGSTQLLKINRQGQTLRTIPSFHSYSLELNSLDRSVWVCDYDNSKLHSLNPDATERIPPISTPLLECSKVSVVPSNGSVWVTAGTIGNVGKLKKYSFNGAIEVPAFNIEPATNINYISQLSACNDGSVWISNGTKIAKYSTTGVLQYLNNGLYGNVFIRSNPSDCSLWLNSSSQQKIYKLDQNGNQILGPINSYLDTLFSEIGNDGSFWAYQRDGSNYKLSKYTNAGVLEKQVCTSNLGSTYDFSRMSVQVSQSLEVR